MCFINVSIEIRSVCVISEEEASRNPEEGREEHFHNHAESSGRGHKRQPLSKWTGEADEENNHVNKYASI